VLADCFHFVPPLFRASDESGGCGHHYYGSGCEKRGDGLSILMNRKEVARSGEVAATSPRVYPEKEVAVHQNGQTAMRKEVRSGKEVADSNLYE
jgi:hypothetical protein